MTLKTNPKSNHDHSSTHGARVLDCGGYDAAFSQSTPCLRTWTVALKTDQTQSTQKSRLQAKIKPIQTKKVAAPPAPCGFVPAVSTSRLAPYAFCLSLPPIASHCQPSRDRKFRFFPTPKTLKSLGKSSKNTQKNHQKIMQIRTPNYPCIHQSTYPSHA